jgi:hypothetical protein
MRDIPYREALGSLMYAAIGTWPDISFTVTDLSRFSINPGEAHWDAVKWVFQYLNGTRDLWVIYRGAQRKLTRWADADGSMAEDRHAILGYAFLINSSVVSWSLKRQEIVSLSTTESEYVAVTDASKEAIWLHVLISQLFGETENVPKPTTLFSNNKSAIALTDNL